MEYERVLSALKTQDQQILDAPHCATGMLCSALRLAVRHAHCIDLTSPLQKRRNPLPFSGYQQHPSILDLDSLHSLDFSVILSIIIPDNRAQKMPVQQIIEDRYIDTRRLQALLARKFHPGTYSMTVSSRLPLVAVINISCLLIRRIVETQ